MRDTLLYCDNMLQCLMQCVAVCCSESKSHIHGAAAAASDSIRVRIGSAVVIIPTTPRGAKVLERVRLRGIATNNHRGLFVRKRRIPAWIRVTHVCGRGGAVPGIRKIVKPVVEGLPLPQVGICCVGVVQVHGFRHVAS